MALDVLVPFSVPFVFPQFHLCVSLVCLVPPVVLFLTCHVSLCLIYSHCSSWLLLHQFRVSVT